MDMNLMITEDTTLSVQELSTINAEFQQLREQTMKLKAGDVLTFSYSGNEMTNITVNNTKRYPDGYICGTQPICLDAATETLYGKAAVISDELAANYRKQSEPERADAAKHLIHKEMPQFDSTLDALMYSPDFRDTGVMNKEQKSMYFDAYVAAPSGGNYGQTPHDVPVNAHKAVSVSEPSVWDMASLGKITTHSVMRTDQLELDSGSVKDLKYHRREQKSRFLDAETQEFLQRTRDFDLPRNAVQTLTAKALELTGAAKELIDLNGQSNAYQLTAGSHEMFDKLPNGIQASIRLTAEGGSMVNGSLHGAERIQSSLEISIPSLKTQDSHPTPEQQAIADKSLHISIPLEGRNAEIAMAACREASKEQLNGKHPEQLFRMPVPKEEQSFRERAAGKLQEMFGKDK